MKSKVFCRTVAKGEQAFYVTVDGKEYYLFRQNYKVSNKLFFQNGVSIDCINNYNGVHSMAVRHTLDKLPSYLRYVEKEYDIAIYSRTNKDKAPKKQKPYKREAFHWQQYAWDVV